MAFQVSPGVNVSEIDLTTVVPATSTTEGAIAGAFKWGPVEERILVGSEVELVNRFGKPETGFNEETFFAAADFLAYSDALYVVRVSDGDTATAVDPADANTVNTGITAKYPGVLGNDLQIEVLSTEGDYFDSAPSAGNFHIAVIDTTGAFSGEAGSVIETWSDLSTTAGSTGTFGENNYVVDVLENGSSYIAIDATAAGSLSANVWSLEGGDDGSNEGALDVVDGYELFRQPEEIDISLIIAGKTTAAVADKLISIAEERRDCVVFLSPEKSDIIVNNKPIAAIDTIKTNVEAFYASIAQRSTYAIADSGYKYRYDRYNDRYTYTPLNGDVAGLCARTDDVRDPWFSPAGFSRGQIKNIIKLAYNPTKAHRDSLYKKGINPVVTQPGQGTVLFGDKTFTTTPSAFDRINVRRLFIVLEKSIARASKSTLFEFNDGFTRAQFRNLVEPFLRDVQGRRGIYDFRVVCDESNNTPEVVDQNRFVGDIYIKPARSINFIQLNFVAVRTGVEFKEIIGQQ